MPSGQIVDFGDLDENQITAAVNTLAQDQPELFQETLYEKALTPDQFPKVGFKTTAITKAADDIDNEDQQRNVIGEVKDKSFRFNLGRMDTDEEKLNYIRTQVGSIDAVSQDVDGSFIIDQSMVTPEAREELGLSDSGLIYADKPGFSWYDLIDFGGEAGPEILGGIIASAAVAGSGGAFLPVLGALTAVGAASAGGRAIDEAIEHVQGYNQQSLGDVLSAIAVSGALGVAGEGGGRAITRLGSRIFKGKGPKISEKRVEALEKAGLSRKQAERAAQEEARQEMNRIIRAGGVPSIQAASDKGLLGIIQEVNELVLPNPSVARKNVKFINEQLEKLKLGQINTQQARDIISRQAEQISNAVKQHYTDPAKATEFTNKNIKSILDKQLNLIVDNYNPKTGLPTEFDEAAKLTSTLYSASTRQLYNDADNLLGNLAEVDADDIINVITNKLDNKNPFLEEKVSPLFEKIRNLAENKLNPQTGQPLVNPQTGQPSKIYKFNQLQQMKEALRIARGDSDLVAQGQQKIIDDVLRAIEDSKSATHNKLAGKVETGDITEKQLEGFNLFKQANQLWADGQEKYNKAQINAIVKDAKAGKKISNENILGQISNISPQSLRQYLDAVTPPATVKNLNLDRTKIEALENLKNKITNEGINSNNIDELRDILKTNELIKTKKNAPFLLQNIPKELGRKISDKGFID